MKKVELRGNHDLENLIAKILVSKQEELLVAFGKTMKTKKGYVFLVEQIALGDEQYITRSWEGLSWDPRLTAQWIRKAEVLNSGIVLIHAHSGKGSVSFSKTDQNTLSKMLPHFAEHLKSKLSGYIVVSIDDFKGDFILKNQRLSLDLIRSVGCPIVKRTLSMSNMFVPSPNHHRQELALGNLGSQNLNSAVIAVVGLGGAGSMVAQQLAHLKVAKIILVDGDVLEKSNLSRVIGSTIKDIGKYKTLIAKRMIKKIDPNIKVIGINEYLPTPKIYEALKEVDIIISCVDKAAARAALNNFSKRRLVPLIDVGVTITKSNDLITRIDGQIIRVNPDSRCLRCIGLISSVIEAKEDIVNYGLGVTNPQVITYNGVLASIALGEMIKLISGIGGVDDSTRYLAYDGLKGEVRKVGLSDYICPVCKSQYAQGDPAYN